VATPEEGKQYILNLKDVSLIGHGSREIENLVKETLASIPIRKINSLMSDSASIIVAAR